jgi:hypothetical protein
MKSFFLILLVLLVFCFNQTSYSTTLCVAKDGSCPYTSIQAAINAAATNDTVKVMPGTYYGSIVIGKKIVVIGSGHEVTKIYSDSTTLFPAVEFVAGCNGAKLMWFTIQSAYHDGIWVFSGLSPYILNNIIQCCGKTGIWVDQACPVIGNNIVRQNAWKGINFHCCSTCGLPTVYNNIITSNTSYGVGSYSYPFVEDVSLLYNCIYNNIGGNIYSLEGPWAGNIQQDPKFVNPSCDSPNDFHLAIGSPCKDTGREGFPDCEGTRGDMGVFGGPNAYCGPGPVVTDLKLIPPAVVKGETFDIQASGSTR